MVENHFVILNKMPKYKPRNVNESADFVRTKKKENDVQNLKEQIKDKTSKKINLLLYKSQQIFNLLFSFFFSAKNSIFVIFVDFSFFQ
jgi:hypothetical protein